MSASMDMTGLIAGMRQFEARSVSLARAAVRRYVEMTLGDAKVLVPVDTGTLAGSDGVGEFSGDGAVFEIQFGFNTNYAAAVHENLDAKHAAPTQAKYLEVPIQRRAPGLAAYVAEGVRNGL